MGRIEAPLGQIEGVGAGIASLAPTLSTLQCATNVSGLSDPPATAAALEALRSRWQLAAQRLEDEIETLGVATQATAVAYRAADESSMSGGGGVGGGGAW